MTVDVDAPISSVTYNPLGTVRENLRLGQLARFDIEIPRADARVTRHASRRIPRALEIEFARAVGIEQIVFQHAPLDHHRALRDDSLIIEGTAPEQSRHSSVVDYGERLRSDLLPHFSGKEGSVPINGRAADGVKQVAQQGARRALFKHHRHLLGDHFPRVQTPQRTFRGARADSFRSFQIG